MFQAFKQYTKRYASFTDEQFDRIESVCIYKTLRRQQYLLQEGSVWKYHAFIINGCLRTYSIDEKGTEHILGFGIGNWWVGDRESLKSGKPSKLNIDAIEKSEVLLITHQDFIALSNEIPAFSDMLNTILESSFIATQQRILSFISHSAEQKYLSFLEKYPGFVNCIPRNMIASFLGIAPETLSRVRKGLSRRNYEFSAR